MTTPKPILLPDSDESLVVATVPGEFEADPYTQQLEAVCAALVEWSQRDDATSAELIGIIGQAWEVLWPTPPPGDAP